MTHKNRNGLSLSESDSPFGVITDEYYSWSSKGICTDTKTYNPDLWFTQGKVPETLAKNICSSLCTVKEQCLLFALTYYQDGIWGGTDEKDRRRLRDERHIEGIKIPTIEANRNHAA